MVKLPSETMCAMEFDTVAVIGNVSVDTYGRLEFHRNDVKRPHMALQVMSSRRKLTRCSVAVVLAASDTYG